MTNLLIVQALFLLSLRLVNAGRVSVVPTESCKAVIYSCVEVDEDLKNSLSQFEELTTCLGNSKVVDGSCVENGFTKLIAADESMSVYASLGKLAAGKDDNLVCWKDIKSRGFGRLAKNCSSDEEKQFGFCFKKCPAGESGEGPLCISDCEEPFGISVGALCCKSKAACAGVIAKESITFLYDIAKAILDGSTNPIKIIGDLKKIFKDVKGLDFPDCKDEKSPLHQFLK